MNVAGVVRTLSLAVKGTSGGLANSIPIMSAKFPSPKKRASSGRSALDVPYQPGDQIPTPDVAERGESVWALWTELKRNEEASFADTEPGVRPTVDPRFSPTEPMGLPTATDTMPPPVVLTRPATLELLMVTARRNNRVCPRPVHWQRLQGLLAGASSNAAQLPVPPLDAQAWATMPPLQKRLVFREQMEWAERHGRLAVVDAFVQSLAESDWLHMGDQ